MSGDGTELLKAVAHSFLEQNRPLQAIRCLEALCLAPGSKYPEQEAWMHFEVYRNLVSSSLCYEVKCKASRHLASFITLLRVSL